MYNSFKIEKSYAQLWTVMWYFYTCTNCILLKSDTTKRWTHCIVENAWEDLETGKALFDSIVFLIYFTINFDYVMAYVSMGNSLSLYYLNLKHKEIFRFKNIQTHTQQKHILTRPSITTNVWREAKNTLDA